MSMLEEGGAQALRRTAGRDRSTFSFDLYTGMGGGAAGWVRVRSYDGMSVRASSMQAITDMETRVVLPSFTD